MRRRLHICAGRSGFDDDACLRYSGSCRGRGRGHGESRHVEVHIAFNKCGNLGSLREGDVFSVNKKEERSGGEENDRGSHDGPGHGAYVTAAFVVPEKAMMQLLQYRLYEDLRRGWRVIQPNLEQCGLLEIEYPGLKELCENEEHWTGHPVLQAATPDCRYKAIHSFLDHLRREMAIDAVVLDPAEEWDLKQRVQQNLRDPWAFDNDEIIRQSCLFVLPGSSGQEGPRDRNLTERSKLAQFLRSRKTWDLAADLAATDWEPFIRALVKVLNGNFLLLTKIAAVVKAAARLKTAKAA